MKGKEDYHESREKSFTDFKETSGATKNAPHKL